ncbi:MAG TPA: ATP-binding protein, partial [Bacteroidales bacterium]|nr:ATP-binding protein [Bacteroidales bacterium]
SEKSVRIIFLVVTIAVILIVNLIQFLNNTNRKIRYFFDSVKNDDSGFYFAENEKNNTVREIHKSMNRVNDQIRNLKIEIGKQEQYFRILIEHLAIGIITYNKKGHILHYNTSAKNLLGVDVLTHIQQLERIDKKLYRELVRMKPAERRLVPINTENGEIQLSLKSASFGTDNRELIILSVQDIKNELDEKEVESWMKLIRILMHEIMNSITPITSLSESLSGIFVSSGEPVPPERITSKEIRTTLQGLSVIKEQGKGLMSFVESYRQLTRIPKPDKRLFRVSDLFNRLKVLYATQETDDGIELSYIIREPDLEIFADQSLISQVLINIIKNASEAITGMAGGKIRVSAGYGNGNHPEIYISDNGPGIPPENIDQIFVPFFTTRENGYGIGLSVSRQIMSAHGGALNVVSVPGKETTFRLSFKN